jgi:hypothetical protein
MAKRHHKGEKMMMRSEHERMMKMVKARAHESEGMHRYDEMHERDGARLHRMDDMEHERMMRYRDGLETGRDGGRAMYEPSERRMERRDGDMLTEDHRAIANMPQNVIYREYGRGRPYLQTSLDDTMSGIDHQQYEDVNTANRHKPKSMY